MPNMFAQRSLAAGEVNPSVFSGNAYEFARQRAIISLGVTAAATGTFTQIQLGARTVATEFEPPVLAAYPLVPDSMYVTDVVEANDRILVPWRNPTAGAVVVRSIAQLSA